MKFASGIELEKKNLRLHFSLVYRDYLIKFLIESFRVVLHIVYHVQTLVVQGSHRIFGIIFGPDFMKGQKGVHEGFKIHRIVAVLVYKTSVKRCAVDEHRLVCRRRAETVCLSPVWKSIIVILLFVILVVIRQILDTFRTVCTIFSLCRSNAGSRHHENDRKEQ